MSDMSYEELLLHIKEHLKNLLTVDDDYKIRDFLETVKIKLRVINLNKNYGLKIQERDCKGSTFIRIDRYKGSIYIDTPSTILNSTAQPTVGEELMSFDFPTGAYIFGNDYDKELFNEFFEELKTYGYKYIDEINHHIYFDLVNGTKLFNEYPNICQNYQCKYNKRAQERKKERLLAELREMEDN